MSLGDKWTPLLNFHVPVKVNNKFEMKSLTGFSLPCDRSRGFYADETFLGRSFQFSWGIIDVTLWEDKIRSEPVIVFLSFVNFNLVPFILGSWRFLQKVEEKWSPSVSTAKKRQDDISMKTAMDLIKINSSHSFGLTKF